MMMVGSLGEEPRSALSIIAGYCICETCGGFRCTERSLYGLVHSEMDHAIDDRCNGGMIMFDTLDEAMRARRKLDPVRPKV